MKCRNCKAELSDDAAFCARCGMPVDRSREWSVMGVRITFPVWVILIAIFCAIMIVWLPRTIPG
ncbi:zinc-ribbon domain-containing protein [Hahella sp. SMD15-11]|uniref:Zinc-ribbon domain-containing protein n=1 Tax=Thermohahella caldifontis TaxID=3142973 RepID=A0AB39UYJ1_9GAMM